jgi:hypothetical protein
MNSWRYAQLPRYLPTQIFSFSLLEMLRFRVHGGFGQLDDTRQSGIAPSDRGGAREVCPHSRISKPEQAALPHNVEEGTQDLWGGSTGKAIPSHDVRRVAQSTRLTGYNFLNHPFTIAFPPYRYTFGFIYHKRQYYSFHLHHIPFRHIRHFSKLFTASLYFTTVLYYRVTRDIATSFHWDLLASSS